MPAALRLASVLAWRNLWRNRWRSLIMLAAIVLGAWAMVFLGALTRGMIDGIVNDGIDSLPGHAQIHHSAYADDPSVEHLIPAIGQELAGALASDGIRAWSARLRLPAMVVSERASRGVVLLGVAPAQEAAAGFQPRELARGRFLESAADPGVVVGRALLERLETRLGHRVALLSQTPDNSIGERGFRIVGVYRAQLKSREERHVYAGREVVQRMLGIGGGVSEIAIRGADHRQLGPWYQRVRAALPEPLALRSWRELDAYLALSADLQDVAGLVFTVVIFAVLSFGLVNTLAMSVFERVREFGLQRALGARPGGILLQVLLEACYLLALGLLAGNALAWLSLRPLGGGIDLSFIAEGLEMFDLGSVLYPRLRLADMARASALVAALGLLASLLPAWRAARLDPVRALSEH